MQTSPRLVRSAFLPELLPRLERTPARPSDEGAAQVREWQEASLLDDAGFSARLHAEGLAGDRLARLLTGREEAAPERDDWYASLLATVRAGLGRGDTAPRPGEPPFACVLRGLVAERCDELRAAASELAPPIDWDVVLPGLQRELGRHLLRMFQRTLVLEMHVARLEERLQGDTPQARHDDYCARLLADPAEWDRLFAEYQVLARLVWTALVRWRAALLETLARAAADWPALCATFFPGVQDLRVVELLGELSDPHREARAVRIVGVCGGDDPLPRRVVYKPKSLEVDAHFQALLSFCNAASRRGALHLGELREAQTRRLDRRFPEFRTLAVLPRAGYGWIECVAFAECDDEAAVARFYARQGAYLALMHLLDGTDMHFENVIACGEHPVLIDLEMLFHPGMPIAGDPARAETRANESLRNSVIRTGLLPGRFWGENEVGGLNIGGLGSGEDQITPRAVLAWADAGTDQMHAALRHERVAARENLPRRAGAVAPVGAYEEELVAGFEAMLRFVIAERAALLAEDGPLAAFAGDEVRRLVRATSAYGELLHAGHHPDHLRDAMDREQLLDMLWAAAGGDAALLRLTPAEKQDMRLGDIPFFTSRPGSRDIWDSRGARIEDYLPEAPLDGVRARARRLDQRALRTQVSLIRAALSAALIEQVPVPGEDRAGGVRRGLAAPSAVGAAQAIAAQIEGAAILGEDDVAWVTAQGSGERAFNVLAMGPSLYDGVAGVGFFLAYLDHVADVPGARALAERAARTTRRSLLAAPEGPVGGFFGPASQLYALAHLSALWGAPELLPPLAPQLAAIAEAVESETKTDVVYGLAGGLLALLTVHAVTGAARSLEVARACGRRLRSLAIVEAGGAAWPSHVNPRPLLGFSHGAGGVAYALTQLAEALARAGEDAEARAFADLAAEGFRYERGYYDPEARNWPDLREIRLGRAAGQTTRYLLAWCHGAPGVALSRLSDSTLAGDPEARREVEAAIEGLLAQPMRAGMSLCHGEVGNLTIAARAARALQRSDWSAAINARLERTLARLREGGPQGDFTHAPGAPELMTGTAGIGHGLLQLVRPDAVPTLLALAPPVLPGRR